MLTFRKRLPLGNIGDKATKGGIGSAKLRLLLLVSLPLTRRRSSRSSSPSWRRLPTRRRSVKLCFHNAFFNFMFQDMSGQINSTVAQLSKFNMRTSTTRWKRTASQQSGSPSTCLGMRLPSDMYHLCPIFFFRPTSIPCSIGMWRSCSSISQPSIRRLTTNLARFEWVRIVLD